MTRREFLAISCKMKVLAAEFLDEHADVNSCKILMQTKDGEAFEFATIKRDGGHIVEGGSRGGIVTPDSIMFVVGNDGAIVSVPFTNVATLYTKPERSENAPEQKQN